MRAFVVLAFFVAAASAYVAEIPGYKYGPGVSGKVVTTVQGDSSNIQPVTTLTAPLVTSTIVQPGTTTLLGSGGLLGGSKTIVSSGPLVQNLGSTLISPVNSGIIGGNVGLLGGGKTILSSGQVIQGGNTIIAPGKTTVIGIDAVDSIPQTVEYNKQVYYFEAPLEEQNEGQITQQLSNVLKKNLQVVFIKAPENIAATNAALQLAKQAIEQRTAIYVLSKENDASQIVGTLQQIQESIPTTPEVRIIKYRTQQDLINAQASIQAQYDSFGGPSALINGGIIPVLNYASGVGHLGTGSLVNQKIIQGGIYAPSSRSYLPPVLKK